MSANEQIVLERSDFHVRLANNRTHRNSSSVLVKRMYAWRGYDSPHVLAKPADEITFQACRRDKVFGTLSLCFDSDQGLAADALYRAEIDAYRQLGARVCELTRLAVDPGHGSKHVLGVLFHLAYLYGGVHRGATDVFIEVNPRHVNFYQRALHFTRAGECRMCPRVQAPAVLMHLQVARAAELIARDGGGRGCARSSLYPYFFSKHEEEGIAGRMLPHGITSQRVMTVTRTVPAASVSEISVVRQPSQMCSTRFAS